MNSINLINFSVFYIANADNIGSSKGVREFAEATPVFYFDEM